MSARSAALVILLVALSLLPTAAIEASGRRPSERVELSSRALTITDGRVTGHVDDAPLTRVLDALAALTTTRIDVDVDPGERVTAEFIDVPLDEIARRLLPGRPLLVVYEHARDQPAKVVAIRAYAPSAPRAQSAFADAASDGADSRTAPRTPLDRDRLDAALGRDIGDLDPGVRERAARALGRTWDEGAIAPLSRALRGDGDAAVREAAARALGHLWREGAVEILGTALGSDPARAVREAAARALGDIAAADGVPFLVAALGDHRSSVREAAVRALGDIDDGSAHRALVEASLTDLDPWVRATAAACLEDTSE